MSIIKHGALAIVIKVVYQNVSGTVAGGHTTQVALYKLVCTLIYSFTSVMFVCLSNVGVLK